MRYRSILMLVFLICVKGHAAVDPFEFENETQRERYQHFIEDMRCPKCQNQNLAGSDAPIANDLRHELQRLLKEGKSDSEITEHMVSRYGEFILYKPPFDKKTAALWLAPIGFLVIGIVVLINVVRSRAATTDDSLKLTVEEQAKLQQLLREKSAAGDETNNSRAKEV
jgi:cytochrome c-type biogenesis protein CcmH